MLTLRCISLFMTATEDLYRSLVLLLLVIFVCCRIGISSKDINPVVLYLLECLCEELSNKVRCSHCVLVMEIT